MRNTLKARLEDLEQQLASRTEGPTMIIVDIVSTSAEGPEMVKPAGYTCSMRGKRHFFPGTADEAAAAARLMIAAEPRVRGVANPVPVLMACLDVPIDEAVTDCDSNTETEE